MSHDLPHLVQSFFQERLIEQRKVSPNTIASYRDTLRLFLGFVSEDVDLSPAKLTMEHLTVERILAFLNYLEAVRGCGSRSRNQRLAGIKAFFHHIAFKEPAALLLTQQVLEIPYKRFNRSMFGFLTKEEIRALLDAPDRSTKSGLRDYVLLTFIYNTGARISEAIQLRVRQLSLSPPFQVRIIGKGDKDRVVPLWKNTAQALTSWLSVRESFAPTTDHVFVNVRGEPLTRGGGRHILIQTLTLAERNCPSLSKKKVSPHTLRHTTAMHLLQSGVDVNVIRMWLGHVSLDTTHGYVEADLDMKRRALEKGGITAASAEDSDWHPSDELMAFLNAL